MSTFVMLSKIQPGSISSSGDFKARAAKVHEMIASEAPEAKWVASYALMGQYDAVDIFEAPDPQVAATVSAIVRVHGGSTTETMLAEDWATFVQNAG